MRKSKNVNKDPRTREYLKCIITMHNGYKFTNPLKLSESHLIKNMVKDHKQVMVERVKCNDGYYKILFG